MKEHLNDTEYRFDLVEPKERLACLNWEYEREFRHNEREQPLKPWLELGPQEKASAYKFVDAYNYVETRPPVSWATLSESRSERLTNPDLRFRRKVVTLPPIMVQWDSSDSALLTGFERLIAAWLKDQRETDPSASTNPGKPDLGKPTNVLSLLADLAVYRLRRRMNLSGLIIFKTLEHFEKLEGASTRIIQGKVFHGNLATTCRRVEKFLT
jgi:hypothetical protein